MTGSVRADALSTTTERSGLERHAFTGHHWLLLAFLQPGALRSSSPVVLSAVMIVQTALLQSLLLGIAGFLYATSRQR